MHPELAQTAERDHAKFVCQGVLPKFQSTGCSRLLVSKIEMLTPKGEHIQSPCATRVMFDGRIIFDGIATAKNLVIG